MKANIDSTEDLLPPNFDALVKENFKKYSKTMPEHLVQEEFYQFLNDFFNGEKEICADLVNQEFYNQNNKSNSEEGLNYKDFNDAFHDCYLLKNKQLTSEIEDLDDLFG